MKKLCSAFTIKYGWDDKHEVGSSVKMRGRTRFADQRRMWWHLKNSIRPLDYVVMVISVLVFVGITILAWQGSDAGARLTIKADLAEYVYNLDKDQTVEIAGTLGPSFIEIKNGSAHFFDSPCRDKLCIHAGWLKAAGQWAACMPNRLFMRVESSQESNLDATTS